MFVTQRHQPAPNILRQVITSSNQRPDFTPRCTTRQQIAAFPPVFRRCLTLCGSTLVGPCCSVAYGNQPIKTVRCETLYYTFHYPFSGPHTWRNARRSTATTSRSDKLGSAFKARIFGVKQTASSSIGSSRQPKRVGNRRTRKRDHLKGAGFVVLREMKCEVGPVPQTSSI